MNQDSSYVAIHIDGPNVTPESVSLGDLVSLLSSVEAIVRELVGEDAKHDLVLSLPLVERGSSVYKLWTNHPEETRFAIQEVEAALAANDVASLPVRVQKHLRELSHLAERYNGIVEMYPDPSNKKIVARIHPPGSQQPTPLLLSGQTTIYGQLVRVGGSEPKARLELTTGEVISCRVSRELAKLLGPRLYERIGLVGTATWDTTDWRIVSFVAHELLPYQDTPITLAFKALAEAAGPDAWTQPLDEEEEAEEDARL